MEKTLHPATALLMTAIASKAGASIQIFPSWDSFTGIERECFYVSKSGSISEYVVTILGDVEAFDQAFEAMGYNRSNPLGFKVNGSYKKIFISGSDPTLKVIQSEDKLSPESLVWTRVGFYQPDQFVASNYHEGTLCSELHRKVVGVIEQVDGLGIKSFVAPLRPDGQNTSRENGKGRSKGRSKSNHTNTNGATRSFKGSGKGQGKIKNEQRFITLSVAVNLAIPEHQASSSLSQDPTSP